MKNSRSANHRKLKLAQILKVWTVSDFNKKVTVVGLKALAIKSSGFSQF
jgi:hypothetical protein